LSETFVATRVAYSAFGAVKSLSGKPEKHVVVEAFEEGGHGYEETVSDNEGNFRLRGLNPGSTYKVAVKPSAADEPVSATEVDSQSDDAAASASSSTPVRIERASPSSVKLVMKKEDAKNLQFTAFRRSTKFDLTGSVSSSLSTCLDSLEVVVCSVRQASFCKSQTISSAFPFFLFDSLPQDTYTISLRSPLSPRTYHFSTASLTVDLDQHTHVEPVFNCEVKQAHQESSTSSLFSVLVAVAIAAGFLYRRELQPFFDQVNKFLPKRRIVNSDAAVPTSSKPSKAAARRSKSERSAAKKEQDAELTAILRDIKAKPDKPENERNSNNR
jgi:hypothetical protein